MSVLETDPRRAAGSRDAGFTYIEVLVASALLIGALLALAGMFILGVSNVSSAGNTTMALAAARQVMEDVRELPFDSLPRLDRFDSDDPNTLPASGPEREVARRWRQTLAGEGVGWTFSDAEQAKWPGQQQGHELGAVGSIDVISRGAKLTEVKITVAVPGRWRPIEMSTLITDLQ